MRLGGWGRLDLAAGGINLRNDPRLFFLKSVTNLVWKTYFQILGNGGRRCVG